MRFSTIPIVWIYLLAIVVSSSLFADMPLPFPEESILSETEMNSTDVSEQDVSEVTKPNEIKETSEFESKVSGNVSTEDSAKSLQTEDQKTTNVNPASVQNHRKNDPSEFGKDEPEKEKDKRRKIRPKADIKKVFCD